MGEEDAGDTARRQAARLATMAGLARPVQHEINNLLTVIFANLEMLKRTAAEGGPQRQLDRVAEAARRFEASSRGFLSLSRRPVPGVSVFTLEEALVAVRPLLVVLMPTPAMLAVEPGAEGWPVRIDRALLDEALIALAREAGEALPRGGGRGARCAGCWCPRGRCGRWNRAGRAGRCGWTGRCWMRR